MAKTLTKKQKDFANAYIDSGNGTKSALATYDVKDENSAAVVASTNLSKLKIQEYIADKAEDAASMVYKLSQTSKQDFIKLNASKDILDRAGYQPVAKSFSVALKGDIGAQNQDKTDLDAIRDEYEAKLKAKLIQ